MSEPRPPIYPAEWLEDKPMDDHIARVNEATRGRDFHKEQIERLTRDLAEAKEWAKEGWANLEIERLRVQTLERGDEIYKIRAQCADAISQAHAERDAAIARAEKAESQIKWYADYANGKDKQVCAEMQISNDALAALREAKKYVEYATRGSHEQECKEAMELLARIEQLTKEPRP